MSKTNVEAKIDGMRKDRAGFRIGDDWFRMSNPTVQLPEGVDRGDKVKFQWSEGKDDQGRSGKDIVTKVFLVEKGQAPGGFKGKGKGGGGGWKEDPNKQQSIVRQACMKAACELVAATLTGKSNAEEAAQLVAKIAGDIFVPFCNDIGATAKPANNTEAPSTKKESKPEEFPEPSSDSADDFDDDMPF